MQAYFQPLAALESLTRTYPLRQDENAAPRAVPD